MFQTIFKGHAVMAGRTADRPLVAIVGATGTGKSSLAVYLAERFNGEVINGDALQLYEGLPIATNKISDEERRDIPHHLIGCIGIDEPTWTVGTYIGEAIKAMNQIHGRGKLPILVGGTHYYSQSLLVRDQTIDVAQSDIEKDAKAQELRWPILGASAQEMLEALRKVDPDMAARWHPNDVRKIRRSLEIWLQTGRKASDIYGEQVHALESVNMGLRFNTLVLWLHADSDVLNQRTSSRLDTMASEGLLAEVQMLRRSYVAQTRNGRQVDDSRGIWVAIGYKEFADYMQGLEDGSSGDQLLHLKEVALDRAKIATRQYAKRQVRWIRLKLLPAFQAAASSDRFFVLDGTDLDTWSQEVLSKADNITACFLAGDSLPDPRQLSTVASTLLCHHVSSPKVVHKARECGICGITCTTERSWDQHMKSKKHRKASRTSSGK